LNFYFEIQNRQGIISVVCWAHVRRKFIEIIKLSNNNPDGIAFKVVEKIDQLYKIERLNKDVSLEERLKSRQAKSIPILKDIILNGILQMFKICTNGGRLQLP